MAVPTKKQLEKWAEGYVRTWNEGDREAWCQNYLDIAPGEYTMWDPVGTPPKRGFDEIVASYDLIQGGGTAHDEVMAGPRLTPQLRKPVWGSSGPAGFGSQAPDLERVGNRRRYSHASSAPRAAHLKLPRRGV